MGMRAALVVAFIATQLILPASPASACSCAYTSKEQQARSADVVFTGRVRSVELTQSVRRARFRVRVVYKGDVDRRVLVVTASQGSACGCHFREGERYTVFGYGSRDDRVSTDLCSGTKKGPIDPAEYGLPPGRSP